MSYGQVERYELDSAVTEIRGTIESLRYDLESRMENMDRNVYEEMRRNYSDLSESITSVGQRLYDLEVKLGDWIESSQEQ